MVKGLGTLLMLLVAAVVLSQPTPKPSLKAEYAGFPPSSGVQWVLVDRVIDGDTISFFWLVRERRGRLNGINAPELRTADGKLSKQGLESMARGFSLMKFKIGGREKYGGVLVEPYDEGGNSLCERLVANGYARKASRAAMEAKDERVVKAEEP